MVLGWVRAHTFTMYALGYILYCRNVKLKYLGKGRGGRCSIGESERGQWRTKLWKDIRGRDVDGRGREVKRMAMGRELHGGGEVEGKCKESGKKGRGRWRPKIIFIFWLGIWCESTFEHIIFPLKICFDSFFFNLIKSYDLKEILMAKLKLKHFLVVELAREDATTIFITWQKWTWSKEVWCDVMAVQWWLLFFFFFFKFHACNCIFLMQQTRTDASIY